MKDMNKKHDNKEIVSEMKKKFGYKNNLAIPKIVKVVISTGIGKVSDKAKREAIEKTMTLIAGQKVYENKAKKSIASFKSREGMVIGLTATLRGKRMNDFLGKLINITLPRVRDFRGLNMKSIDEAGNFSIGFKEHTVFPEASEDDVRSAFGLSVTIVTTAKTKEEAIELLSLTGIPFNIKDK